MLYVPEIVEERKMDRKFVPPDFGEGDIELRFQEDEICIYASEDGLKKLIEFCQMLLDNPQKGHLHLEDYEVLTSDSLRGVMATFKKSE